MTMGTKEEISKSFLKDLCEDKRNNSKRKNHAKLLKDQYIFRQVNIYQMNLMQIDYSVMSDLQDNQFYLDLIDSVKSIVGDGNFDNFYDSQCLLLSQSDFTDRHFYTTFDYFLYPYLNVKLPKHMTFSQKSSRPRTLGLIKLLNDCYLEEFNRIEYLIGMTKNSHTFFKDYDLIVEDSVDCPLDLLAFGQYRKLKSNMNASNIEWLIKMFDFDISEQVYDILLQPLKQVLGDKLTIDNIDRISIKDFVDEEDSKEFNKK